MSVRSEIDRINANISSTYDTLGSLGASLPATRNSDNLAAAAGSVKAVLYSYQDLTADQQTQARNNIGVALPSGETSTITPQQVMNAVAEGRDVVIGHTHSKFGMLIFTSFIIASSLNAVVSSGTFALGGDVAVCQLYGDLTSNTWTCTVHEVAQSSDIPTALKNPNALTFAGAVSGTYDGSSAKTITIPTIAGEPGKTPVKYVDYFTSEDQAAIVSDVLTALKASGVAVVEVDANKNITLAGNLADGAYILKYENADGSTTEICTLNVSGGTGTPDLPDVPDEPDVPAYTNLVPTAKAHTALSTVYNGTGYKDGTYASSTPPSYVGTDAATTCTGVIPVQGGTVLYIKGITLNASTNSHCRVGLGAEHATNGGITATIVKAVNQMSDYATLETLGDQYYKLTISASYVSANIARQPYVWISGIGTGANLIVTNNEPIE